MRESSSLSRSERHHSLRSTSVRREARLETAVVSADERGPAKRYGRLKIIWPHRTTRQRDDRHPRRA